MFYYGDFLYQNGEVLGCWSFNKSKPGIVISLVSGTSSILLGITIGNVLLSDIISSDWEVDSTWKLVKLGFWITGCLEELVLTNVDLITEEWLLTAFSKSVLGPNFC